MSNKIKQLDNQQNTETSLVPHHCFCMPIVGSIGEGKTTILVNLLTSTDFYKQKFHRIVFISVTAELDEKIQRIFEDLGICISNQPLQDKFDDECLSLDDYHERTKLPKYHGIDGDDIYDLYDSSILQNLYKHQKSIISQFGKSLSDKCLLVIDDAITASCYIKSHQDEFARFCTSLRHVNCSVIHCTQLWKAVPKVIRTQSTAGIFCGVPNELEIRDVFENFACGYPFHKWQEIFNVIVSKPFRPIVFDLKSKKGCKIRRAFDEYVG
jgi:hypothetical protein